MAIPTKTGYPLCSRTNYASPIYNRLISGYVHAFGVCNCLHSNRWSIRGRKQINTFSAYRVTSCSGGDSVDVFAQCSEGNCGVCVYLVKMRPVHTVHQSRCRCVELSSCANKWTKTNQKMK